MAKHKDQSAGGAASDSNAGAGAPPEDAARADSAPSVEPIEAETGRAGEGAGSILRTFEDDLIRAADREAAERSDDTPQFVEVVCEGVLGPKLLKKGDVTSDPDYVKLLDDPRGLVKRA